jgi:hypothetical protein
MLVSKRFILDRHKTLDFLKKLESGDNNAVTCYFPSGALVTDIGNKVHTIPALFTAPREVVSLAAQSETGAVLFWGNKYKALLLPPFPLKEKYFTSGYETGTLVSMLVQDHTIALVLVRLGSFAVGVCRGEVFAASKVGTGLVHGRHRQGGSSSGRFARHREKQIEIFLIRVCEHAREKIEPYARELEYIVFGGARTTILMLRKQCSFLQQFEDRMLPVLLTIPDPRQAVLEDAVHSIWSSHIVEWAENDKSKAE